MKHEKEKKNESMGKKHHKEHGAMGKKEHGLGSKMGKHMKMEGPK